MQLFYAMMMCANVQSLGTPHQLAFALPAKPLDDHLSNFLKNKTCAEEKMYMLETMILQLGPHITIRTSNRNINFFPRIMPSDILV